MTGRTVWFNCCAGVAGDMLLASLVDAGADVDAIASSLAALRIDEYAVEFERVQRCGVGATLANVAVRDDGHATDRHAHRPAREVLALIGSADLPVRVRERALAVYRALAEVEGAIHGVDAEAVELHEVGALDSIIDVVGVCIALEALDIDTVACSPIAVGHGTVPTQHGDLPNPVPAVTALLARANAPTVGLDTTMETATPTGVALMTVLAGSFGAFPSITVTASGFGAGAADPPGRPNVVQAVIGDAHSGSTVGGAGRPARLLEANVDDVTGEVLAHTIATLLTAGAFDAWATPIVMKKGRPAHTVHALCDDSTLAAVSGVMIAETGTLGVRATIVERWPQHREERWVDVGGHPVRVKRSGSRVKAEHDDAVAAATALGIPLREVLRRAETADDGDPPSA